jgi:hypothetical protein
MMPERAKLTSLSDDRRMHAIQRELAAFEKLENDFNARERKERAVRQRAVRLGLVLGNYSYSSRARARAASLDR